MAGKHIESKYPTCIHIVVFVYEMRGTHYDIDDKE